MPAHIAIIGTGPTGVYTFKHLVEAGGVGAITLFEKAREAGVGMPYCPEMAARTMLANIASIEIPPIEMSYLSFLKTLPQAFLRSYGVDPLALDDREFTPRLLLGRFFRHQFLSLVETAQDWGIAVSVLENTEIVDIERQEGLFTLVAGAGERFGPFDRVVLATGHEFEKDDDLSDGYFPNPWSGLLSVEIPAARVGIMGTSLSSIDAAMAVVTQHGQFVRSGEDLQYRLNEGAPLTITLMSRHGILPEADFYCPIPYERLRHFTDAALALCARSDSVLDNAFALFAEELADADPDYAEAIGLGELDADSFADAYFARRLSVDPFRWARENLTEVERNKANRVTVAWRYALLRMHEKFETLVPEFSERDAERFAKGLKRVFIDNYAAVPSESIRRLLALRDAGILEVIALGEEYELERGDTVTTIVTGSETFEFEIFIDARGQKALETGHLKFPTLRKELLAAGQDLPQVAEDYSISSPIKDHRRLYLAAIPYLMHERPFAQGIVVSNDIGQTIANSIAGAEGTEEVTRKLRRPAYAAR
jgi:uncharacterized NAD(P)/FAD-binding protein YdhS